uniref:F-box domain and ankyrin repeat protein n=1 Tax=Pithovirus LCPAC302 TaxID=2506593 RepID=A0A481Z6W1_9VIRU|nr:MAG: F-box domain and ankyrin repeat protein [Pithovirus LCPAC302]
MSLYYKNIIKIMNLPTDIVRYALEFLDDENLAKACMSSPEFSKKICNSNFWLKKIKERFPELISPNYPGNEYINRYKGDNTYWAYYYNLSQLLNTKDLNNLFVNSVTSGRSDIVRILLKDTRVDPAIEKNTAIQNASYFGNTESVELLLSDPRVNPTANNNLAIHFASQNGHKDVVKLLLNDPRVDPSVDDNYPIRIASQLGYPKMVKLLLKDIRVDPTVRDNEAIRRASSNLHIEIVKLLLTDSRVYNSLSEEEREMYLAGFTRI